MARYLKKVEDHCCRASKCPFLMSSINRTRAARRAVYIIRGVQTRTSLQNFPHRRCWASVVGLSCKTFNRSKDSSNKVLLWRYRSTLHHRPTLHTTPTENSREVSDQVTMLSKELAPSTNPSIWICNIEVIPYISIEVCRELKVCTPAVLGHQNKSEQIVTPVRSETSMVYSSGLQPAAPGPHAARCFNFGGPQTDTNFNKKIMLYFWYSGNANIATRCFEL